MSPEEPRDLPADAATDKITIPATPPSSDTRFTSQYAGAEDNPVIPPSRSLFAFVEVTYPHRPRFPAAVGWGVLYFGLGILLCNFFWIFAQLLPAVVALLAMLIRNCVVLGTPEALSEPALKQLQKDGMGPALMAGHVVAILLALLFLRLQLGPGWTRRLAMRLPGAWHALLTLLLAPAVIVLGDTIFALVKKIGVPNLGELTGLPIQGIDKEMADLLAGWPWWLAVLLVAVGPALSEELWCRGLFGLGLFGRNGVVARILVTAFYFGLIHGDPQQGTMATCIGIVLYFVLLTTRCFWMPVLLHFLNNGTAVVAPFFEHENPAAGQSEGFSPVVAAGAVVFLATIALSLYRTRARLASTTGEDNLAWQPVYAGLEHPPRGCGVVVVRPWPNLLDVVLVVVGVAAFGGAVAVAWAM